MKRITLRSYIYLSSCLLVLSTAKPILAETSFSQPDRSPPTIVGGSPTSAAASPYQAMLLMNGQQGCGGTLIDPYWVLTAAHCIDQANIYNLTVRVGATRVSTKEGQTIPVSQIIIHPYWMGAQNIRSGWDIGLLRLSYPADSRYTPAKLPTDEVMNNTASVGQSGTVSGWGATYHGGRGSDQLLAAQLQVISNQACQQQLNFPVPNSAICAGYSYPSACNGDSGGPFVTSYKGNVYSIGTVSWGERCASTSVFTKTHSYNSWITQQTGIVP
ncbi:serine protease [Spartinivicinus poritis]|uniref:Serine protease n=1 Tax=Spartinivicinus poritis TaxID=2994640 RepID=A0ABT5UKB8_9GAMM|nr:serine protease [Spartinivicinus sp. A2-2]MDE1465479.1 serine protease [Spartinivicinus sp. A2-2]